MDLFCYILLKIVGKLEGIVCLYMLEIWNIKIGK